MVLAVPMQDHCVALGCYSWKMCDCDPPKKGLSRCRSQCYTVAQAQVDKAECQSFAVGAWVLGQEARVLAQAHEFGEALEVVMKHNNHHRDSILGERHIRRVVENRKEPRRNMDALVVASDLQGDYGPVASVAHTLLEAKSRRMAAEVHCIVGAEAEYVHKDP